MKLHLWLPMLWSEVVLSTVTLCSEVFQLWICTNYNVFRTVLPELWPTGPSIHTSIQLEKALHWLPIKYRSIFKTAVLVYKFLHSGNHEYFEPFLIPRHSAHNIRQSQSDGMFLELPTLLHFSSPFRSR